MIRSIHFQNFKALRDATLPLGPFTLILGPNGSGKSTAMQAFDFVLDRDPSSFSQIVTAGLEEDLNTSVSVHFKWLEHGKEWVTSAVLQNMRRLQQHEPEEEGGLYPDSLRDSLYGFRSFSFDAKAIATPVQTSPNPQLGPDGSNLAGVLDALRDSHPEKFEELNRELHRWLPEFDRILFETPAAGKKTFLVRTKLGHYSYRPADLSQGVLFALAFLTLAYLPTPPPVVCFEEPDRGIHPRLLIDIRDAMYRLAFPQNYGETRQPVQVIATTHSPYLLDLYKEHPEQIVIAHKDEKGAHFERLSEKPHITELLEGAPLGDIWFSGILGGVPVSP
ncbi:MAG TPA: AAA family ATPase [Pyrinomonadaceae bacterium]|nr:AAA family ATPase [Pyrinomonadaceae bacterium]